MIIYFGPAIATYLIQTLSLSLSEHMRVHVHIQTGLYPAYEYL